MGEQDDGVVGALDQQRRELWNLLTAGGTVGVTVNAAVGVTVGVTVSVTVGARAIVTTASVTASVTEPAKGRRAVRGYRDRISRG